MAQDPQSLVWKQQSSRWKNVGQPTRPSQEDSNLMLGMSRDRLSRARPTAQVVVLGVTPEVVQINWPEHTRLHAFDQSAEMIKVMWQPHARIPSQVTQSFWQALPLSSASVNVVVGDGCLTALYGKIACQEVLEEMARILRPDGGLVMRCFIRPPIFESLETISSDVLQGKVQFFGSLKWRLAMALCDAESSTVRPHIIRDTFNEVFPDRDELAGVTGWNPETIDTIDSYRDMKGYFTFPNMAQFEDLCSDHFEIVDIQSGDYELSNRCPTVSLAPRSN